MFQNSLQYTTDLKCSSDPNCMFIFTARRYASAVYAVVVCHCLSVRLSVCLSVWHKPALYQNG